MGKGNGTKGRWNIINLITRGTRKRRECDGGRKNEIEISNSLWISPHIVLLSSTLKQHSACWQGECYEWGITKWITSGCIRKFEWNVSRTDLIEFNIETMIMFLPFCITTMYYNNNRGLDPEVASAAGVSFRRVVGWMDIRLARVRRGSIGAGRQAIIDVRFID